MGSRRRLGGVCNRVPRRRTRRGWGWWPAPLPSTAWQVCGAPAAQPTAHAARPTQQRGNRHEPHSWRRGPPWAPRRARTMATAWPSWASAAPPLVPAVRACVCSRRATPPPRARQFRRRARAGFGGQGVGSKAGAHLPCARPCSPLPGPCKKNPHPAGRASTAPRRRAPHRRPPRRRPPRRAARGRRRGDAATAQPRRGGRRGAGEQSAQPPAEC